MVLSGAVTGISMMMNEKTTMNASDDILVRLGGDEAPVNEQSEWEVDQAGPVEEDSSARVRAGARSQVVWDNDVTIYNNIYRSDTSSDYRLYDDFIFGQDQVVMDVHWLGGNWGGGPSDQADVVIEFYDDNSNTPGDIVAGPYNYAWDDIYKEGPYSPWTVWYNEVDLPEEVEFDANEKYWLMIAYEGPGYPYWGWAHHYSPIFLSPALQWAGYWRNTGGDAAWQLTVKFDHDVGVTEIKHPRTCDTPGCPCIPVEVEVTNFGTNDEFDVPVHIEIHRTLFHSGFELPDDEFMWNFEGMGPCNWQFVMDETWFPYKVEPNNGDWMMEFNQHGSEWCEAEVISHEPVYLCGDCIDPYLKFYMWHDDYGSDDYLDVWVSTDGKYGNYVKVAGPLERLCCPDCPIGWLEHRVSLEEFICQPIWIKFIGHSDGTPSAYNLHIDDVEVFDLEYVGDTTVDLEVGETKQVEFECWDTSCWWCQYENEDIPFSVGAWTEMEGDEYQGNDGFGPSQNKFLDIYIHIPWTHDVGDKEIEYPDKDYYRADEAPIQMKQKIKNYGKEPEGCFYVYMAVRLLDKVTKLDETFDCWDYTSYPNYYVPCGWSEGTVYRGWERSFTNYAGGDSPEARLNWYYAGYFQDTPLISPSINTEGEDKLELIFKSRIDHYSSSFMATVEARADPGDPWTDYTPWANPVNGDIPAAEYTVDITPEIGVDTQVRFNFFGYYYYLDYWFVDDVKLISYTCGDTIYHEKVCIDTIDVCEEINVPFPDWTPEPPEDCYCGTVDYCIESWTKMMVPPDQNNANDLKRKFITVEFLHDVALIEFTSPVADIGVDWLGYTDGHTENAFKWTDGSPWTYAIELSDPELAPYRSHDLTDVHFSCGCDDYGFYAEQYDVYYATGSLPDIAGLTPIASGTASATGWTTTAVTPQAMPAAGSAFVIVQFTTSVGYPGGFDYDAGDIRGQHMLYHQTTNDWRFLQDFWGSPAVWGLEAGLTVGGNGDEVPEPEVFLPCGEHDISVLIENLGTYHEDPVIVDWKLYEYTPAKTEVDGGQYITSLDPGEDEDCFLGTYAFTVGNTGVYELEAEVNLDPASMDCNLANNGPETVVIGIDCCEPDMCFVLDPESPDGENNWYLSPITVTADAWETDDCVIQSGISHIVYIVDGVMNTLPGDHGEFVIDGDGVHFVLLYAVDNVGHEGIHHTFEVAIDTTAPTCDLVYNKFTTEAGVNMVEFTALAGDSTSGMNRVEFSIDGVLKETIPGAGPYVFTVDWTGYDENTEVCAEAFDNAGNDAEDCESGIKFEKSYSHSYTRSKSLPVSRIILNLGR
jgi:hypothetical protein